MTLSADLGPCPAAGILVGADNITLNLNGHRVFGAGTAQDGQYAGVLIAGHSGVTVTGGRVEHFSAGVAIVNSSHTTVKNMTVRDNVGSYDQLAFADGIVLFYASNNTIVANTVVANGVFDNIGVFGHFSDHNLVQNNTVTDSVGIDFEHGGIGINISFNAFSDVGLPDRGSSLVGNQLIGNTVLRAYANGMSNRGFTQGQIIGNTSDYNGVGDATSGFGLGVLGLANSTPHFQDLVQSNTVHGNPQCGIEVGGFGSRVISNTATGNGAGPFCTVDLQDDSTANPPCANVWHGNTYIVAGGSCVTFGGHQVAVPPAVAGGTAGVVRPAPSRGVLPRVEGGFA
ncbi:MAG: right-handed parallel beta-helix repeat-containing protein, partial [Actinomycetota bacterium]|nr:right-handed parallel beta-helix repeat-containing protein [Actinomycetota bacterium]